LSSYLSDTTLALHLGLGPRLTERVRTQGNQDLPARADTALLPPVEVAKGENSQGNSAVYRLDALSDPNSSPLRTAVQTVANLRTAGNTTSGWLFDKLPGSRHNSNIAVAGNGPRAYSSYQWGSGLQQGGPLLRMTGAIIPTLLFNTKNLLTHYGVSEKPSINHLEVCIGIGLAIILVSLVGVEIYIDKKTDKSGLRTLKMRDRIIHALVAIPMAVSMIPLWLTLISLYLDKIPFAAYCACLLPLPYIASTIIGLKKSRI